jgi:phage-related protein
MILDNLGIQVSLAEATDRAAAMFGVEAEELTKAQQQAGMMDVVLAKLKENTASMPDVAGTAAQGWAAFQVTLQNTKDRIGLALVPALQSIMEPLSGLTDKMLPVLVDWFEAKVIPAVEKMAGAFGIFFEGLSNGRGFVTSFEDALWKMLPPDMAAQITGIIDKIAEFGAKIQEFVSEHAEAFKAALIAIGAVIAGAAVAGAIMSIAGAIAALANPITLIIAAVGLLAAAWTENWGGIQDKTKKAIEWISPKVKAFVDNMKRWWADHGTEVTATVTSMWTEIQQWFTTAIANVTRWVQTALANIKAWWSQHGEAVMSVVKWLWDAISNAFATAFGVLKGIVSMALAIIRGDWHEAGAALRGIVDTMWAGIRNAFELGKQAIVAIVQAAASAIRGAFSLDWCAVGRGIIDGIAGGVRAAAGWLGQAAADAARAALDAAKGFLGIRSPSKVTAELIGKPFAQGIYKGIEDASRVLERTKMPDIMASMVATPIPTRAGAGATSTVNNSPQYHLHITTSAPTENIMADFAVLQALAG